MKAVRSWTKPDIPDLIVRKKVDFSVLKYGTHIPVEFHEDFERANGGIRLDRGKNHKIKLVLDGVTYEAVLYNINRTGVDADTLQIRYFANMDLKNALLNKLRFSHDYIQREHARRPQGASGLIIVPDELAEYIEFYQTEEPFTYGLKIVRSQEYGSGIDSEQTSEVNALLSEADSNRRNLNPEYSLDDCSEETGIDREILARWVRAIERKGQAILYGPPGTGKTYLAERLASHLIGGGTGFAELVQFHPAYAYEDFIQGIRPKTTNDGGISYPLVPGRFLDFCGKANLTSDRCVLIIDEINRAYLSRVFGELMYLLEYRRAEVPLAGGGMLSIPENVFIIGTMNTADRSIALVDHALRRRFSFIPLFPAYDVLRNFHELRGNSVEGLIQILQRLNQHVGDRNYEIGISFFLKDDLKNHLEDIWLLEIEPYLEEYFFDQPDKLAEFRWSKIKEKLSQ